MAGYNSMTEQVAAHYGLTLASLARLDAGADSQAEVYRAAATNGKVYFLKATRRAIPAHVLRVPHLLVRRGIPGVIAPLATREGTLWTRAGEYKLIVYPFLESVTSYAQPLGDTQWEALGRTLAQIHTTQVAFELPRETFPTDNQAFVTALLGKPLAPELESFRPELVALLAQAQELAQRLRARGEMPFVLTHGDLHAWNVVVDAAGQIFVVDWDEAQLAPRERDLMFLGGGVGGTDWCVEQAAFWRGYGEVERDPLALAYFRCERILADIVATDDAEQMARQFEPGNVVEIANATYRRYLECARRT